mmetsp:Transcript_10630/g.37429  ORF Transcript_10630/g.37429 Transcript_10630/m.37429 type:complete len:569 (+) Transcript_10630:354-2060(+)
MRHLDCDEDRRAVATPSCREADDAYEYGDFDDAPPRPASLFRRGASGPLRNDYGGPAQNYDTPQRPYGRNAAPQMHYNDGYDDDEAEQSEHQTPSRSASLPRRGAREPPRRFYGYYESNYESPREQYDRDAAPLLRRNDVYDYNVAAQSERQTPPRPAPIYRVGADAQPRRSLDGRELNFDPLWRQNGAAPRWTDVDDSRAADGLYHARHPVPLPPHYIGRGPTEFAADLDGDEARAGDRDGANAPYDAGAEQHDATDAVEINQSAPARFPCGGSLDEIRKFCKKVLISNLERRALYDALPPELKAFHSYEDSEALLVQIAPAVADAAKGRAIVAVLATRFYSALTTSGDGRGVGIVVAHIPHVMGIAVNSKTHHVVDTALFNKAGVGTYCSTCGSKPDATEYFTKGVATASSIAEKEGRGISDALKTAANWCKDPIKSLLQLLIESGADFAWVLENLRLAPKLSLVKESNKRRRGAGALVFSERASVAVDFAASLLPPASTTIFDAAFPQPTAGAPTADAAATLAARLGVLNDARAALEVNIAESELARATSLDRQPSQRTASGSSG